MKTTTLILLFILFVSTLHAQIDSQWRGENRDGKYSNEKLLKSWPAAGPALITTLEGLGIGYSSPAVTDDCIYITGKVDDKGYLFAFDLTGNLLWRKAYGDEWDERFPGARVTPTVIGNRIYLSNSLGQIFCFDTEGNIVWTLDMIEEFDTENLKFGLVESILVDGDFVYCTPGTEDVSVAVLDKNTGKVINKIKGNGQTSTYCSPRVIDHNGRKILVTMLEESVVGFDVKSSELLFDHKHYNKNKIHPNTPLYINGYLYVVSGYNAGGQLLKLSDDGTKVTLIWEDPQLDSQMGSVIVTDGHIYGSGHKNRDWYCLDFMTGEVKYSSRELGRKGNIIFADGMLYIYSEKGDVALVKPNSEKFEIISSFELENGTGEHWAHPVIKNGRLYVRHGDILNIYNIAG